jgi:tRNA(Ile)-lysidine synthase
VKHTSPLVRKVKRWLARAGVPPDRLVVAVSGGPDSVALLHALLELRAPTATGPLVVAHLNHQLRGPESDADEAFVRQLHAQLTAAGVAGLQLRSERIDVAARAQAARANLENAARLVRYDWLAEVARQAGVSRVATGHTADDQAETVLHHLLRGTGLQGLRGIAGRRPLGGGVELIRPLLTVTRAEVQSYLEAEGRDARQDSSNLDLAFTRNRIRHELLPHLADRYNPAITAVLCRLAEQAEAVYTVEEAEARVLLAEAELPRAGAMLVFDRRRLASAPRQRLRELFRLVWRREGWPVGRMCYDAWDRIAAVALQEIGGVDLPGGIAVRGSERVVQVRPGS